jgi:hypothetical protein
MAEIRSQNIIIFLIKNQNKILKRASFICVFSSSSSHLRTTILFFFVRQSSLSLATGSAASSALAPSLFSNLLSTHVLRRLAVIDMSNNVSPTLNSQGIISF